MNRLNYPVLINQNVTAEKFFPLIAEVWLRIGLISGKREIEALQAEIGQKNLPLFNERFQSILRAYIRNLAGTRITSMNETLVQTLIRLFAETWDDFQEIEPVVDELEKQFNSKGFYRWQIARIARTEATAAGNYALLEAGKTVGIKQKKVWLAVLDERTRNEEFPGFSHVDMDGVEVEPDAYFEQSNVRLQFPGDPNATPRELSAGMVINCRCRARLIADRDAQGRLQFTTGLPEKPIKEKFKESDLVTYEDEIKDLNYERGGWYDQNGNQVYEKKGEEGSVQMTDDEFALLEGRIFTHNHPIQTTEDSLRVEYSPSFSDGDLRVFGEYGSKELRAVTPDGRKFRFIRNFSTFEGDPLYQNPTNSLQVAEQMLKESFRIKWSAWDWIEEAEEGSAEYRSRLEYIVNNSTHWAWERVFQQSELDRYFRYSGEVWNPKGYDYNPNQTKQFSMEKKAEPNRPMIDGQGWWDYLRELFSSKNSNPKR